MIYHAYAGYSTGKTRLQSLTPETKSQHSFVLVGKLCLTINNDYYSDHGKFAI